MLHLAVLGDPVGHSRSPAIHSAALAAAGINGVYEARRTSLSDLPAAFGDLRAGVLDGANVTMPLKRRALQAADESTGVARRAGAANTVWCASGRVWADNTDVGGIRDVWERRGIPTDAPVLVLGAGGAAMGALVALEGHQMAISARDPSRCEEAVRLTNVTASVVEWGTAVPGAVVVNATPLGMRGEVLPGAVLDGAIGLLDMAYGPAATPAVEAMADLPHADGIDMLVAQAARSFEVWTGVDAPVEQMEAAARG